MSAPSEIAGGSPASLPEDDRRLIVLAAVFVPARAPALLSRLETADASRLREETNAAAYGSRRARLEALALQAIPRRDGRLRRIAEAMAACERPRAAAALRAAVEGTATDAVTRAFRRLVRERLAANSG